MQMRDTSIIVYDEYCGPHNARLAEFRQKNIREIQKHQYGGRVSAGAKKRLTRAIVLLCESTQERKIYNEITNRNFKHRMSFITLTITTTERNLSGKEAYKLLLRPFLQWLRRQQKVTTYIWKAELQKRGQIHYHLTTPSYINCHRLKNAWNKFQQKAGLLEEWYQKKHHYNPNSTDIREVRKIKDVAAYMIKEICKSIQNEISIGGKVWDCSENLKQNKYFTLAAESMHHEFLQMAEENEACDTINGERFKVYKFEERPHNYILSDDQIKKYNQHLQKVRRDPQQQII